jgi:hypothetical protein
LGSAWTEMATGAAGAAGSWPPADLGFS